MLIGAALALAGLLVGVWAMVPVYHVLHDPPPSDRSYPLPLDRTFHLRHGGEGVYLDGQTWGTPPTVRVTGPDGRQVPVTPVDTVDTDGYTTTDHRGLPFLLYGRFTAPTDGDYRIQVSSTEPNRAATVQEYRALDLRSFAGWMLKSIGSGMLLLSGITLLAVGLIRRVMRRPRPVRAS
jgi:hypothetical protein